MIPEQYLGMIIVGIFTICSSVITIMVSHTLTERRETRRRKEENEQKRLDAAHEFFRRIYDPLAPFLSTFYEVPIVATMMDVHFEESKVPLKPEERKMIADIIKNIHDRLNEAITDLGAKGYLGLLPTGLSYKMWQLFHNASSCCKIIQKDPTLSNITKQQVSDFRELLKSCEDVRNGIRRLLNVDALQV